MKFIIPLLIVLITGCDNTAALPSYEQLVNYPVNCKLKNEQFRELKQIQHKKNFSEDPDQLSDQDRRYNAMLKEHLWWFVYNCEQ